VVHPTLTLVKSLELGKTTAFRVQTEIRDQVAMQFKQKALWSGRL
jgi:hypothetical protein